jgi:hypothetical protein
MKGNGKLALDEVRLHPDRERFHQAAAVSVSEPMIMWARRILRSGTVELVAAVESGRLALYMGARVAKLPPNEQRRFLRLDEAGGEPDTLTSRCLAVPPTVPPERDA